MNGVSVGIGDVSENPSDELHRVEDLGRASVVSWFGLVEDLIRFRQVVKSLKVDGGPNQIPSQPFETQFIAGIDRDRVVC